MASSPELSPRSADVEVVQGPKRGSRTIPGLLRQLERRLVPRDAPMRFEDPAYRGLPTSHAGSDEWRKHTSLAKQGQACACLNKTAAIVIPRLRAQTTRSPPST